MSRKRTKSVRYQQTSTGKMSTGRQTNFVSVYDRNI